MCHGCGRALYSEHTSAEVKFRSPWGDDDEGKVARNDQTKTKRKENRSDKREKKKKKEEVRLFIERVISRRQEASHP